MVLLVFGSCVAGLAFAAAPVDVSTIAPADDIKAEAAAKIAALEGLLEDPGKFADNKKRQIPQAAGVLACLAQALAEHKDGPQTQVAAADLRDAALAVIGSGDHGQAAEALASARQAFEGKSEGKAAKEHEWNKLINLHRMMEEVNARNAKIRIALRRSKDPQAESLHATTLAVLAVAMQADTHEVKDPAQLPLWNEHATTFQKSMSEVAAAIKTKDTAAAGEIFKAAQKSCNACHTVFRKEE